MSKQLHQSQYILQKCFENKQNVIRVSMSNAQDYLNAIYDSSKDALRVNVVGGGMLPVVDDPTELPSYATDGQICPVYNSEKDVIDFYEWSDSLGEWVYRGSTTNGGGGSGIDGAEKEAVDWVVEHLDQLKEVADYGYIVNVADVVLDPESRVVEVQGQQQDIDDDLDGDGDDTTPYRIDFSGYVLSVSTYADGDAPVPDRYYTRITYETGTGGLGTSHIFLQQDEFEYFAGLPDGKNILRVYYLTNATTSPIKKRRLTLNPDGTATDAEGNDCVIADSDDSDGDASTQYCIAVGGYVLGVETFSDQQALVTDKCYIKTVYESDGVHSGRSRIYMDAEEFEQAASLTDGKNIVDIYYLHTVFPASVTISEVQYLFPSDPVEYVVIDAAGNAKGVSDSPDKDGDPSTHVRITVNGYAIDVDGYYGSNDKVKHRLIVKTSYNYENDTTDIYLDREHYEYICSLGNGRNVVSIYTVGAGIGVDASRISAPSMEAERPVVHSSDASLSVNPGGCYRWTVNGEGTLSVATTPGTMSWTYVDIVLGQEGSVSLNGIVQVGQLEQGRTNRCRIECDGVDLPRMHVYESF